MLKEFQSKLESDSEFRAKFADVKSEDELLKLAKAEGYDLEKLSDEELNEVAGGSWLDRLKEIAEKLEKWSKKYH